MDDAGLGGLFREDHVHLPILDIGVSEHTVQHHLPVPDALAHQERVPIGGVGGVAALLVVEFVGFSAQALHQSRAVVSRGELSQVGQLHTDPLSEHVGHLGGGKGHLDVNSQHRDEADTGGEAAPSQQAATSSACHASRPGRGGQDIGGIDIRQFTEDILVRHRGKPSFSKCALSFFRRRSSTTVTWLTVIPQSEATSATGQAYQ